MSRTVEVSDGTALTEVVTFTVTSLNQPVPIPIPAASQTAPLPTSDLDSLG